MEKNICYFCFIVTLVQKTPMKCLVCVFTQHIQTCALKEWWLRILGLCCAWKLYTEAKCQRCADSCRGPSLPRLRVMRLALTARSNLPVSQRSSSPLPHSISTDSNIAIYLIFYAHALHAIGTSYR